MTASELGELCYLARRDADSRVARCTGKERFDTRGEAMRAISHRGKRAGTHPYFCSFCRHWHVGTTIIPKGRRRSDTDEKSASHRRHT